MRITAVTSLAGPVVVGDLVTGTAGLVVSALAFALGCALTGAGPLVWIGFWGAVSVAALCRAVPVFARMWAIVATLPASAEDEPIPSRIAA
jgi:hypothetical protein